MIYLHFPKVVLLLAVSFSSLANRSIASDGPFETELQFRTYLETSLSETHIDQSRKSEFEKHSLAFWIENRFAYRQDPKRFQSLLELYRQAQILYRDSSDNDIERFKGSIEQFQRFDARNTLPTAPVLFVGSSSIVYWETATAFPDLPVVNRGFGGARFTDVNHYYAQIVQKYLPTAIVLYCDVDVEDGKSPAAVLQYFKEFAARVGQDLPETQILFLSMKPTLIDDFLGVDVSKNKVIANRFLKAFADSTKNIHFVDVTTPMLQPDGRVKPAIFREDGEHLNLQGYELWNPIVRQALYQLLKQTPKPNS